MEGGDVRFIPGIIGTIVVQWLPLSVAHTIFSWVLSMIFSDSKVRGMTSIPLPLISLMPKQISIHYWYHCILGTLFYNYIYVLFANCPGELGSIPCRVISKTQKNGT